MQFCPEWVPELRGLPESIFGGGFLPAVPADQSPAGPDAYEDVVDGAQSGGLGKSKPGLLGIRSFESQDLGV